MTFSLQKIYARTVSGQKEVCKFKAAMGISAQFQSGTTGHSSVSLCHKQAQSLGIFPDSILLIRQKI
ncbi:MAG: hypothetical protein DFNUSKGM_000442 [Candidatus Fervidibacter sacchari]